VELTDGLKSAIYDESQGIIDIAVKLFAMAQVKAIATGKEEITERIIGEVAAEKLRLVKPMIDALRSGDKKILQFDDIRPIEIEDYIAAHLSMISTSSDIPNESDSLEEQAVLKLLEMEIPSKTARSCVKKVLRQSNAAQPLSAVVKKAFTLALSMDIPTVSDIETQESDLRNLAADNMYISIKKAGLIADIGDDL
jgi:hypothetical protein